MIGPLCRMACILFGHKPDKSLYSTGGRAVRNFAGPHGRVYLEEHICARCLVTFCRRVASAPRLKVKSR